MGKVIGIDLGTTNSVVAVMEGKDVKVIPMSTGSNLLPSVVGFTDKGERLVGQAAKNQAILNPKNTIYEIKRFMGRRAYEVPNEIKRVAYEVVGSGDDPVRVRVGGKTFTPQEISAIILQELKRAAETYLGGKITDAVITCPAYFNDAQRQATKEAGQIAGLNVRRVFNEPTASSLAYGLDKKLAQKIAVYDLGGGTFDISILEVDKDVIQVLSTNGDTHLGGSDFDQRIMKHVADTCEKQTGIDLRADPVNLQRLRNECERAKIDLSMMVETEINMPFIGQDPKDPRKSVHFSMKLSRAKLEQLVGELVEKTLEPCRAALTDARLRVSDIQEVVLVGGQTRMPLVQETVRKFFGREPHRGVNPDEVVAVGAAIQAAILGGEMKDILLVDVTPLTLGVETLGGVRTPMIRRNMAIPTQHKEVFSTAADGQTEVEVHVVQGEREMAADCRSLGKFRLTGIPPAPRGVPKIEVTFEIDANGILNVSAKDLATNKQQSIVIQPSSGLSKEEVERLVKEAEKYSEEDKKRRELVDVRNHAEALCYQTENLLKEHGDKVSPETKEAIQKALEKTRKAIGGSDVDEIKRAIDELRSSSFELGKKMYESARRPAGNGSKGSEEKKEGKVIDADYETK